MKEGDVGYQTIDKGFYSIFGSKGFDSPMSYNVLNGILVGSIVAWLYNKFSEVELPKVLGFFSGRRLVPVIVIISLLVFCTLWSLIWPWVGYDLYMFSTTLSAGASNRWIYATYSFIFVAQQRPLIALGLHHITNSVFWFQLGEHVKPNGEAVIEDLNIFSQGVPDENNNSGAFMTGNFPIMLFGLPAMAFAMYKTARPENRAKLVGMLTGAGLISFFTGITEPIEFLFYFTSAALFIMHVLLGASFAFIIGAFNIQLGFGFSSGFIDYLISIPNSLKIVEARKVAGIYNNFTAILANPFMLFVIGPFTAIANYFLTKFIIIKTDAMTPGREEVTLEQKDVELKTNTGQVIKAKVGNDKYEVLASDIYDMIGQKENIDNVDWCTTRLRLVVKDMNKILENNIRKLEGILGVVKTGPNDIQIIIGPHVEGIGNSLNKIINSK